MKHNSFISLAAVFCSLVASPLHGADLYWSGDGVSEGGPGTWNTVGGNFGPDGGPFGTVWNNAGSDNAIFESTGGAVTVDGVSLGGTLFVKTSGYTFGQGTTGMTLTGAGATVDVASGLQTTISTIMGGTVSLTKTGSGVMILNSVNTYTGGTYLNQGTLGWGAATTSIGNNSPGSKIVINADNVVFANSSTAAKTPQQAVEQRGDLIVDDSLNVAPAVITFSGVQGAWTITGADRKITVNGAATISIGSIIADDGTVRGLTKAGNGRLTLTGANTYRGDTTVSAGTLAINGTSTFGNGGGTLRLAGGNVALTANRTAANTFLNPVVMSADTVLSGANFNFRSGGAWVGTGGTLTLTNNSAATTGITSFDLILSNGTINFNQPVVLKSTITATVTNGAQLTFFNDSAAGEQTFSGLISGNGSIRRSVTTGGSGGNTILTAANTYSGGTILGNGLIGLALDTVSSGGVVVSGPLGTGRVDASAGGVYAVGGPRIMENNFIQTGALVVGGANDMTFRTGSWTLSGANRSITVNNTGTTTIENVIADDGTPRNLTKNGTGRLILKGANTFGGSFIATAGTLNFSALNNLGAGSVISMNGGTLQWAAGNTADISVRTVTISANSTFDVGANDVTLANSIGNAGVGGLTKTGSGTLTLAGNNTYSGVTVISAGKLIANNTAGSATGTGNVIVNTGATIGGGGTITGSLTLDSGATLAPGSSPGTLNTGSETWAGGANYVFELNNATGTAGNDPGWDLVNMIGTLTLNATALDKFNIKVTSLLPNNTAGDALNFDNTQTYAFKIATASGGLTAPFDANVFNIDTSGFSNAQGLGSWYLSQTGNDLMLNFAAVPEPSTVAFGVMGGLIFLGTTLRRRFKNKK